MEIIKIFSNVEDPEENLYSVLLNEEELLMFSEKKEKKDHTGRNLVLGGTALGLGGTLGGQVPLLLDLKNKGGIDSGRMEERKGLYDKLAKEAKKRGVKIKEVMPSDLSSAFLGTHETRLLRKKAAADIKKGRKTGDQKLIDRGMKISDYLKKESSKNGLNKNAGLGKKVVVTSKDKSAAILSHELGHGEHLDFKNGKGSIIGKVAHALYTPSKLATTVGTPLLAAEGFRRGKNSVKTDEEGNIKVNKKKALKSAAIGAAVAAPMLIAEASASRHGLKMLKNAGASKEYMKTARKDLAKAWGTYAGAGAGGAVGSELIGHGLGVAYGKRREKKKKEKKD